MKPVRVTYCGCTTPLGDSPEALWDALSAGRCAVTPVRRFSTEHYLNRQAACLPALDDPGKASRLEAFLDLLSLPPFPLPKDTLLLTASTKAGIDQLENHSRNQAARMDEALPGVLPEMLARRLGLATQGWNISAACASGSIAIAYAAAAIAAGATSCAVVCGMDLVTEFVFSGFSALKALSATTCRPFDIHRDGLILGEGAGLMVLMDEATARGAGRESLGVVAGWGISGDAHHITAPSREGEGLLRAVRIALDSTGTAPEQVAGIVAHGTGTVFNDAMEIEAFSRCFGKHRPRLVSVKGALGHTMGACGVLEAILALQACRRAQLPPTCGLEIPEPAVADQASTQSQPLAEGYVLSSNSGFGGINAALLLGKGEA